MPGLVARDSRYQALATFASLSNQLLRGGEDGREKLLLGSADHRSGQPLERRIEEPAAQLRLAGAQ